MANTDLHLVRNRSLRFAIKPFAIAVVIALATALFVFPVRTWLNQRDALEAKTAEYAAFEDIVEEMQDQVSNLQSPAGLRDAIRTQLGYLYPNERRVPMMDLPALSTTMPERWPYTVVSTILMLRTLDVATQEARGQITLDPLAP